MSQFGIEFGSRSAMGGGIDPTRIGEQRERRIEGGEASGESAGAKTFGDFLKELATEANSSAITADKKMQEVATGRTKDLHGAVLAVEKADVQFHLLTQVRNKVIDAYREIMRMQV